MRKIILLVFITIIMSGCVANYNLVYEDDIFNESFEVINNQNEYNQKFNELVNEYYTNSIILVDYKDQPGDMTDEEILKNYNYYNKKLIKEQNKYGLNLNYNFKENEDYQNSSIVNNLFKSFRVTDNIILANSINNIFESYPYLKEITVSFKTDKNISHTNADKEDNGIYYWYINKDNYSNKSISIQFSDNILDKYTKIDNNVANNVINYIIVVLLIIIVLFTIIIYVKIKKSNK